MRHHCSSSIWLDVTLGPDTSRVIVPVMFYPLCLTDSGLCPFIWVASDFFSLIQYHYFVYKLKQDFLYIFSF